MNLGCWGLVFRCVQGECIHYHLMILGRGGLVFRCVQGECIHDHLMIVGCGELESRCVQGRVYTRPHYDCRVRGGWCLGAFRGGVYTTAL